MRKSLVRVGGPAGLILVSLVGLWLAGRSNSGEIGSVGVAVAAQEARGIPSMFGQRRPVTLSEVLPGIHVATGNGASFRIDTPDGSVVIDTGLFTSAARMRELLLGVSDLPVKYLILTHAHPDHVGGAPLWIADGVPVIAGRFFRLRHLEHRRLGRYRGRRASVLWSNVTGGGRSRGTASGQPQRLRDIPVIESDLIEPDIVVDDSYTFTLGGVRFEVIWLNGAEGPDAIGVWLPERKVIFIGDAFGPNWFPNLFTLRGENLRDAFATTEAIDRVLALEPEVMLTGHHGQFRSPQADSNPLGPLSGREAIRDALTRTRDAIRYVHDATVAGMNEGKDVWTLMREIELPPELAVSQVYGRVPWGVRAIYEYYTGWFRYESTTELFEVPPRAVYPDIAALVGSDALVARAEDHLSADRPLEALHLCEIALAGEPEHVAATAARRKALQRIFETDGERNFHLRGWLRSRIDGLGPAATAGP